MATLRRIFELFAFANDPTLGLVYGASVVVICVLMLILSGVVGYVPGLVILLLGFCLGNLFQIWARNQ